jgi:cephalosporin-C deacetylase
MLFDKPLPELREYRTQAQEPVDFDRFWADTLAEARGIGLAASFRPVAGGLRTVEAFDVRFAGYGATPVAAWLVLPIGVDGPLPTVVQYIGYTGGRGYVNDHLVWASHGYAQLVVDTRGQGSSPASTGVTEDAAAPAGPHSPGFLTQGIESPERYYYRRVFTDAVRALDVVEAHPRLDRARTFVTGGSQGGGITLAVAGLVDGLAGVLPDVPFLCDMRRASEITNARPYFELAEYCRAHRDRIDNAFATLGYFDAVFFARRADAPALFSVALMDQVCPPSTVFAAYNDYASTDKAIEVYPYNGHEGGGPFHRERQLAFARDTLDALPTR